MYLDERSVFLLNEILCHQSMTSKDLQERFALTRRQIDYSFIKINNWLDMKSYPRVHRRSNGQFSVTPELFLLVSDPELRKTANANYIPSEKERTSLIILMLVASRAKLSLNHFTSALSISKNTVLSDLKIVQSILNRYELEICYLRKIGYQIKGNEWNIRTVFIYSLQHIIGSFCGERAVKEFTEIDSQTVSKHRQNIEKVERRLNLHFVDDKIEILPYVLEMLFRRINKKLFIKTSFFIDYKELFDTREYNATEFIIAEQLNIPEQERLYITLQLLSSNVLLDNLYQLGSKNRYKQELRQALVTVITEFEKNAVVQLQNKSLLLDKLYSHIKPAYYRIKYKLTIDYDDAFDGIDSEFNVIHYFIKQSLWPLEKVIGAKIPENESMLIALFLVGHLTEISENLDLSIKAVIVCSGSLSILRIMENSLRAIFPEFRFYPAITYRQFKQIDISYDIVFTTSPIVTNKITFNIKQVMNEKERYELRTRVMRLVYNIDNGLISIEELMKTIEKYTIIRERKKLEKALIASFSSPSNIFESSKDPQKNLVELLNPNHIIKVDSVSDWKESIRLAAQKLLDEDLINSEYIDAMITLYPKPNDNIILRGTIAIPHAEISNGINQLSMCLLHVKNGIETGNLGKLYFIVVIAATDRFSHLTALLQLMELANSTSTLENMKRTSTVATLYQEIKLFLSK